MATRRDWDQLGERQQKRYLGAGRKQGLTDAGVRQYYESGGNLQQWRGQGKAHRTGVSERMWSRLMRAAKASQLGRDGDGDRDVPSSTVLESLLAKGASPTWILERLREQRESRDAYLSSVNEQLRLMGNKMAGRSLGNKRFFGRDKRYPGDIELYWYH